MTCTLTFIRTSTLSSDRSNGHHRFSYAVRPYEKPCNHTSIHCLLTILICSCNIHTSALKRDHYSIYVYSIRMIPNAASLTNEHTLNLYYILYICIFENEHVHMNVYISFSTHYYPYMTDADTHTHTDILHTDMATVTLNRDQHHEIDVVGSLLREYVSPFRSPHIPTFFEKWFS